MDRYERDERRRHWSPPPELATAGGREVQITGSGYTLAGLAVALAVGSVVGAVLIWNASTRQAEQARRLDEEGTNTDAVITRLWRTGGKDSRRNATYQFEYGGSVYRATTRVQRRIFAKLKQGDRLRVRFLPSEPSRSRPLDWERAGLPHWVAFLVAAVLAGPAALIVWSLQRSRRLLEEGRPAPAEVVRHSKSEHGVVCHYEFPLLNGSVVKGQGNPERAPKAVGSVFCVIYDRDNPRRNAPYPLVLYRVGGVHAGRQSRV